jgi:hypothetical protein
MLWQHGHDGTESAARMTRTAQDENDQGRRFILDSPWQSLPRPPFTDDDAELLADRVYDYVWQRSSTAGASFPSPL